MRYYLCVLFLFAGCGSDPAGLFALGHVLQEQRLDDLQEQIDEIELAPGLQGEQGPKGDTGDQGAAGEEEGAIARHYPKPPKCRKILICHRGTTIEICASAKIAHKNHGGDYEGVCD
jgi:hypothetical protein